ncbi:DUF1376 domain-containing protein [Acinetobacter sp. S40]|uniref:DUF1376 domain-containing protein n=1 Tax=Acinetobacter sp. S40 TaxID=2767434 RepID=UPI00190A6160|nr:DUF1376 domain-containing protein [Acinetobacter sp. S40]MBJ9986993.1 DUF1376 domain-containing protein [Acinetobacter sp. S40]
MNNKISIWMPVYIGDLQAKFARLTTEQIGATFLLMMDFWKNGDIPFDLSIISSISKLNPSKSKALIHTLVRLELFELSSTHLTSTYISSLKEQATQNQKMKSDKAKLAAQARWNKSSSNAQALPESVVNNAHEYQLNCTSTAQAKHKRSPSSSSSSSSSSIEADEQKHRTNWI